MRLIATAVLLLLAGGCAASLRTGATSDQLEPPEKRAKRLRDVFVRVSLEAQADHETVAYLARAFDRRPEEAQGELCRRVVDRIADGRITPDQVVETGRGHPIAKLELVYVVLDRPEHALSEAPSDPPVLAADPEIADERSVRAFFEEVAARAEHPDLRMADSYADDARITWDVFDSDRRPRRHEISGARVKSLIRRTSPADGEEGPEATYRNITVAVQGRRAWLKAERHGHCVVDTTFLLIAEVQPDRRYRIVEEHVTTNDPPVCG